MEATLGIKSEIMNLIFWAWLLNMQWLGVWAAEPKTATCSSESCHCFFFEFSILLCVQTIEYTTHFPWVWKIMPPKNQLYSVKKIRTIQGLTSAANSVRDAVRDSSSKNVYTFAFVCTFPRFCPHPRSSFIPWQQFPTTVSWTQICTCRGHRRVRFEPFTSSVLWSGELRVASGKTSADNFSRYTCSPVTVGSGEQTSFHIVIIFSTENIHMLPFILKLKFRRSNICHILVGSPWKFEKRKLIFHQRKHFPQSKKCQRRLSCHQCHFVSKCLKTIFVHAVEVHEQEFQTSESLFHSLVPDLCGFCQCQQYAVHRIKSHCAQTYCFHAKLTQKRSSMGIFPLQQVNVFSQKNWWHRKTMSTFLPPLPACFVSFCALFGVLLVCDSGQMHTALVGTQGNRCLLLGDTSLKLGRKLLFQVKMKPLKRDALFLNKTFCCDEDNAWLFFFDLTIYSHTSEVSNAVTPGTHMRGTQNNVKVLVTFPAFWNIFHATIKLTKVQPMLVCVRAPSELSNGHNLPGETDLKQGLLVCGGVCCWTSSSGQSLKCKSEKVPRARRWRHEHKALFWPTERKVGVTRQRLTGHSLGLFTPHGLSSVWSVEILRDPRHWEIPACQNDAPCLVEKSSQKFRNIAANIWQQIQSKVSSSGHRNCKVL